MGKQRRGRDGSANQGGGARAQQGSHAGKGNRAVKVYANARPGRAPAAGMAQGNAIVVAITRKGDREVDRWQGPMNWPPGWEPLPVTFTGTRAGGQWIWSDERADDICLDSSTPAGCGIEIEPWADQRGAAELVIRIVGNPGTATADASAQGPGTQSQGTHDHPGEDFRDHDLAEMHSDMLSPAAGTASNASGHASGVGNASRSVDGAFREMFAAMLGHESHEAGREDGSARGAGLGEQGARPAQGMRGEQAVTGRGQEAGKPAGEQDGSRTPSWYTRFGAAVDNEWGGRTPDLEHGKPGGSTGGQQGGEGSLLGIWNGPIDIAGTIAIAVNAAIVLLDANVTGLGEKFLDKVVRGLSGKRLRKELAEEAGRVIDDCMPGVEKQLAADPGYQAMNRAEQQAALAQARERLKRDYHAKARAYFAEQAERSGATAQKHGSEAGELAAHERELAAANARAYRELEQAAADNETTKAATGAIAAGRAAKVARSESTVWKSLKERGRSKQGRITTGNGKKTRHYEWDHTHGDVEVYDGKGRHLGSMHPETGELYKPPVPGRRIEL